MLRFRADSLCVVSGRTLPVAGTLLRLPPVLLSMFKCRSAATRSVVFTFGSLVIIMYALGIALTQTPHNTPVGDRYFEVVLAETKSLLVRGVFLTASWPSQLRWSPIPTSTMFYVFILVGALTVMHMLIGALCKVVSAVAATEHEEMLVSSRPCGETWTKIAWLGTLAWFDRVESGSNPVDGLSRGRTDGPWTLESISLPPHLLPLLKKALE